MLELLAPASVSLLTDKTCRITNFKYYLIQERQQTKDLWLMPLDV